MSDDEKLEAAIAVIRKNLRNDGTVSKPVSMVQRHLNLGYSEASKLVEKIKMLDVFKRDTDA